jgi:hypothetical protein
MKHNETRIRNKLPKAKLMKGLTVAGADVQLTCAMQPHARRSFATRMPGRRINVDVPWHRVCLGVEGFTKVTECTQNGQRPRPIAVWFPQLMVPTTYGIQRKNWLLHCTVPQTDEHIMFAVTRYAFLHVHTAAFVRCCHGTIRCTHHL